jgi:hypothetical protein
MVVVGSRLGRGSFLGSTKASTGDIAATAIAFVNAISAGDCEEIWRLLSEDSHSSASSQPQGCELARHLVPAMLVTSARVVYVDLDVATVDVSGTQLGPRGASPQDVTVSTSLDLVSEDGEWRVDMDFSTAQPPPDTTARA